MGCGSSRVSTFDEALFLHLSRVLGMPKDHLVIKQYVASLRSEGWDTPEDFDALSLDELKCEPFCFKAGHLKKVDRSRKKSAATGGSANAIDPLNRGRNSEQNRVNDPDIGLYQHQDCQTIGRRAEFPGSSTAEAVPNAVAADEAETEAAATTAADAADAARAAAIADARRRAKESPAQADNDGGGADRSRSSIDGVWINPSAATRSACAEPT